MSSPEPTTGKPAKRARRRKDRVPEKPAEARAEETEQSSVQDLVAALAGDEDGAVSTPEVERVPNAGVEPAAVEPAAVETDILEPNGMVSDLPMDPDDDLTDVEGEASRALMSVAESLLFAATKPMTVRDLRRILKEPTVRQIQLALKQLMAETADRGVVLGQVAGGFRLRTNPQHARWVQHMVAGKPVRLSRSQLEALAVVAYRQPLTKAEIDHIRGVDCSAVLKLLLDRDLVKIVGRKEEPGRPHLYGTSVKFLEFFNLRSLRDMPDLHEFRELTEDSQVTLRERLGDEDADLTLQREVLGQEVLHFEPLPTPDDSASASSERVDDEAGPESPDQEEVQP